MNGAIRYDVAVTIDPSARQAYLDWLRPHVQEILRCDGFLSADIFIDANNPDVVVSSYAIRDMAAMKAYLDGPAAKMRADGVARFGAMMSVQRLILEHLAP